MIDEMKENEQQADSVGVTVDMETGKRSDSVPSYAIIEHEDGKRYIAADKVEEYKAHRLAEVETIQQQIDDTLAAIAEIDRVEAAEERQQIMADFVAKNGDDYDLSEVVDFNNVEEFEQVMDYLNASYQSTFGNASAGFGTKIESRGHSPKQWQYEQGAAAAREIFQKRRR